MYFLYGSKPGIARKLVATFDSEPQLLAYVNWATLAKNPDGTSKFEQGSSLAGYQRWGMADSASSHEGQKLVVHNPSPTML